MAKASISIGVNDATGQPASAPQGPYITDEDDGSRPRKKRPPRAAAKRDRADVDTGRRRGGRRRDPARGEDLASRRKGPAQP